MSHKMVFVLLLMTGGMLLAVSDFNRYFENKTLRLDYFHTGNDQTEAYSFDEVYQESVWAGSMRRLIDPTNMGKYLFQVFDAETGTLIYSRGFCSLFGEWQTTDQAAEMDRTFSESIRFPWPKAPVNVSISVRDSLNVFQKIWTIRLDPAEANYIRSQPFSDVAVTPLVENGDPHYKVDVVILPDGYTEKEMPDFHEDARRLLNGLFSTEPFKSNQRKFNVRSVDLASNESGIDNPRQDEYRDNAMACSFNAFGSDRYILTRDNKTIRKAASRAPYDHLYLLVHSEKYGGGGIFNLYSTCVSDNKWSEYIFVHEFGHSFGGLADEYYTSDTAYNNFYPQGVEPWEPNITITRNRRQLKWRELIDRETPIPTPWNQCTFDSVQSDYRKRRKEMKSSGVDQSKIDSLIAANDRWVHDFLRGQTYWSKVGAFEGGGYCPKGIYRPFLDCRMFTRSLTGFDPVCARAIEAIIRLYSE